MSEGPGRWVICLHPLGHPHVRNEMRAFWEEFLEFATVEERFLRLWRVERVQLRGCRQICYGREEVD